ncbi:MAG TPA: hypothetical protein P5294_03455 [Smithellaceae bacterium]|nr:hypothetical protein [Smithellaceae bacterium]HRS88954.1 hypothetical protein [Smithellaceae bacterium]HRV25570.1 hypothetical protein [Smithellaceae bacterium]
MIKKAMYMLAAILMIAVLAGCGLPSGTAVIDRPDEYAKTFEAKEEIVLRAIAAVFREKEMGSNVAINRAEKIVTTDYLTREGWRTRSIARVRQINWKESEVILTVITERQSKTGWQMRRLLGKEQYDNAFDAIEMKIYEEMAKRE